MKSKSLLFSFVVAAAWAAILVPSALAQTGSTGALAGTVTDATSAVVPGATITLVNTGTNQTRTATSGVDGSYRFNLLEPGSYRARFSAMGFKIAEVGSISVTVTETAVLDRSLEVGAQSDQVPIEASTETLQTATST